MALDYLSVKDTPAVTVGAGRPWDIFFFVSEILTGASKRHFNEAFSSMVYTYRTVGFACAKAVFAQRLGFLRLADAARFIVVRVAGRTSGAALLREVDAANGAKVLVIEFLAVTPVARRHGVGRILVEYAQRRAPAGGVECYCRPESRAMQRLLKRQGFVRTQRSKDVVGEKSAISLPSRWIWLSNGSSAAEFAPGASSKPGSE